MTVATPLHEAGHPTTDEPSGGTRFRLNRAGILNVWQYDDQEFAFADGRMLLRGANGAGKSKTLEILLPFVLDGDKARITASGRHHTSLLWLMTDGYDGQARTGYVWVEFARRTSAGEETFTCGVGIRASATARTATAWHFVTSQRIGHDLLLEDDAGPLFRPRLVEMVGGEGTVFDQARAYKEHVGRHLFGLGVEQYDEVLRLLYWLRQPQIGEDIEPARLAGQLAQALPQLEEQAVRAAGDTFDELAAFGEQIERRSAAADALVALSGAYARYARCTVGARGAAVLAALKEERHRAKDLRGREREQAELAERRGEVDAQTALARTGLDHDQARLRELEASPEARDQRRLAELADQSTERRQSAESAQRRADRSAEQHKRRSEQLVLEARGVSQRVRRHAQRSLAADKVIRDVGVATVLAPPYAHARDPLDAVTPARALVTVLEAFEAVVERAASSVGVRQAAVRVVLESIAELAEARRECATQESRAAEAEQRWEESRERQSAAQASADGEETNLWAALRSWAAENDAPMLPLPAQLDQPALAGLPGLARSAADPVLTDLRGREREVSLVRDRTRAELQRLVASRHEIEQETDPAPAEPVLGRTLRADGAALWHLVDFAPELSEAERAGLEAGLQASGLLDAWVRPDGMLLDADHRDVVLPLGTGLDGPTLADVLVPDCPAGGGVTAEVVTGVLRRVGLGTVGEAADEQADERARVGLDGGWSLGPLLGRAAKERAQYVGATARAQERRRRLDEVDQSILATREEYDDAAARAADLAEKIAATEAWLQRIPATQPLAQAWATLDERAATTDRDEQANAQAQRDAHSARQAVARRREAAERLAEQHDVPVEPVALEALQERLRSLAAEVSRIGHDLPGLAREVSRWADERAALDAEAIEVDAACTDAVEARGYADRSDAALAELRATVGASVRELEERLGALRASVAKRTGELDDFAAQVVDLARQSGEVGAAVAHARERVVEHRSARAAALAGLTALVEVPGMLESAFADRQAPDLAVVTHAGGLAADDAVSGELAAVVAVMAAVPADSEAVEATVVWRAYSEATSGPAADHEPRVVEIGDLLAVTGQDQAGESTIGRLASRVAAGVQQDRELLTERERQQFEQHVLGELGDAIRRSRLEAEELVAAMNELLADVTTTQGIRVRLDWRLREDVPAEVREAVRLLTQPVGALLPEERAGLRDSLHRLIEASRAEHPELAYGEHLASALDYRSWSAFRIRYTRPESEGRWLDLHRRSPLSQGEQKVLCYLPLFAAAAAHFTSLAGAAPYAPRLVLLDDAFPKIDVRTHPLLFGLLVQLDLDFVVTSERLWGDHDTVPSLAIYEALRDPAQRGIAQYEYRWDGRALRSIS